MADHMLGAGRSVGTGRSGLFYWDQVGGNVTEEA